MTFLTRVIKVTIESLALLGLILGSKSLHEELGVTHVKKPIYSMNIYFNFAASLNQTFMVRVKSVKSVIHGNDGTSNVV